MTGQNFTVRAWLAFDPPSSTSPTWVEITSYVDQESPISIGGGRADGLSDVNNATCSLTVDNTDGRFSEANKSGPWYGQLHKGNWLRIELTPPSGTVSKRFTGFINNLPNQWAGETQSGQITASDRFEKLGAAKKLISSIQHEVLSDPNLAGNIQGYWNLHEGSGSLTFGDTSGAGAQHMVAASAGGVATGVGFAAGNVSGPGFDGLQAVSFNPPNAVGGLSTTGTFLTAPITSPLNGTWNLSTGAYSGLYGTLEFWFQLPVAVPGGNYEVLASINDPLTSFGVTIVVSNHKLIVAPGGMNTANQAGYSLDFFPYPFVVDDGQWHHMVVSVAATNGGGGWASIVAIVDGIWCRTLVQTDGGLGGTTSGNFTQLVIGGGFASNNIPGVVYFGTVNVAEVAWYWSDLMNLTPANGRPPDALSHYQAATTGFAGESTDVRIARLARYIGLPQQTYSLSSDSFNKVPPYTPTTLGKVQSYIPATTPWLNLSPGAHQVGSQSISGRAVLDVMREAARTENMPLYVNRAGYLTLQDSTIRQNTTPAWSVDAYDLDGSTAQANDFAYLTNQMTVTPNSIAEQTVIGAAGSAGQLSQAKYGEYDGSVATASVNPVEAQSLGLGVIQLRADPPPRLAPLAIEAATLSLLPGYGSAWYDAVLATDISTAVRVTNAPAALGGGNYDCLVEGWTETIVSGQHLLQFNVSPIPGPTYQLDDAVRGRLDTDGTSLVGALNTTATTFTAAVATTSSAAWTTAASDFPFDVLVDAEQMTVTSVAPVSLGVDGTFETGVSGWTLSACTFAQSTVQAHGGTHSALLTANASGATYARTPQFTVYPGAKYLASFWAFLAAGSPVGAIALIEWYTSSGTFIAQAVAPFYTALSSSWAQATNTAVAPSNAAFAAIEVFLNSNASGNAMYVDDVTMTLLTGGQQQFTVTRSVNGVVASHLAGAALALAEPLTLAY